MAQPDTRPDATPTPKQGPKPEGAHVITKDEEVRGDPKPNYGSSYIHRPRG